MSFEEFLWKKTFLHAVLLPPILRQFAQGLRLAFWAWVLITLGVLAFGLSYLPPLKPFAAVLGWPTLALLIVGMLMTTWSKQRCFEFAAPIASRWAISWAFWLDLAAIGLRFTGRNFGLGPSLKWVAACCAMGSLIFFLIFLERLSRLIGRRDLQRSAWLVIGGSVTAAALMFLFTELQQHDLLPQNKLLTLALFIITPVVAFLTAVLTYGRLLWSLSAALRSFADYLDGQADAEDRASEEADDAGEIA